MRTLHPLALIATLVTLAFAGQSHAAAPSAKTTTHLLAMAACPSWKAIPDDPKTTKLMADSCEKDIDTIVPAISKSLNVAKSNVTTKLNADADYKGVSEALTSLANRAKPEDRVVIYLNFHGGDVDAKYQGYGIKDEVLALYTESEPKDFAAATADGSWMTMKNLRDLVDQIQAKELIVIFEVCESSGGFQDFRYDLARRYAKSWKGREAIIFSSRGDQAATYNEAGTIALFTELFSKHLTNASSGNIRDIFERSAIETHRSRRTMCMKQDNLDTMYDDRAAYMDGCTQMPLAFDPYGLLDDIQHGGTTLASRWQEIEDQNRKPVLNAERDKKAAKSASKAAAPASKPSPAPAKSAPAKAEPDPFAWTKPFMGQQSQMYPNPYAQNPYAMPVARPMMPMPGQ